MNFEEFKAQYEHKPVTEHPNQVANKPTVSVCVQTYNQVNYIKDCLEGILMQKTDFPIEILLGEDASSDGTREICMKYAEKYPDKIRLFLHHRENNIKIDGNPSGRFNFLYNLYTAQGKYIALCEGDDYWTDPLKLQKQVDLLETNEEIGIVHTKYEIKNDITNTSFIHDKSVYKYSLTPFQNYLFTGDMRTLTVMFRSIYLKAIHALLDNGIMEKALYGDRVTFLTIAAKSDIGYLDEVMGVYRIYPGQSATRSKSLNIKFEKRRKIIRHNLYLMSYLDIKDNNYITKCKKRLIKTSLILLGLKIPFFEGFLKFLYNNMGLGGLKNTNYY